MLADPLDLNLRHLRALAAIVERGSLSAAADAIGLSQPALTLGLAKLERQLDVTLFDRRPDGMSATSAGRLFADRAVRAMAHLAGAARSVTRGNARGFARPEQLMTATQLRALLALADTGSFAGASRATGLSAPALHRAVRELEQLCFAPLAIRRGRGVVLSEQGRRLARGARLATSELAAAIAETGSGGGQNAPARLRVGAMPMCRAVLLPASLARLARVAPRLTVDVIEGSWRELVEPLRDGTIDLMIGALRPEADADLVQHPLFVDQLEVIARAGHPLAGRADVSPQDLARYSWITGQSGTPIRAHWERLFRGLPPPPTPVECGSIMVIRRILQDSDFLALASPDQVALELRSGILATVGAPLAESTRTIGITTRAGWRPTAYQQQLVELLEDISSTRTIPKF